MKNSEKILHQKFVTYGANAKEWMRKCVFLLPEIEKRRIWKKKGFSSIYEYAAKLAGMSHRTVDDALRILKKIKDKPELKKVAEEKGINSVRPVAIIATQKSAAFWAEKAKSMTKNSLELYVREFRGLSRTSTEAQPEKMTIFMDLDMKIANELGKLKGDGEWNDLMKEAVKLIKIRKREKEELESEKPEPIKTKSRYIPTKTKKFILKRANRTCEFPGCTKKYDIFHHTDRFALKKEHNPDKIAALCREHERLAHLGLIENEHDPPQFWQIRKNPDKIDIKYMIDQRVAAHRSQSP